MDAKISSLVDRLDYYWRFVGAGGEHMEAPDDKIGDLLREAIEALKFYALRGEVCAVCGGRANACRILGHRPESDRHIKWQSEE